MKILVLPLAVTGKSKESQQEAGLGLVCGPKGVGGEEDDPKVGDRKDLKVVSCIRVVAALTCLSMVCGVAVVKNWDLRPTRVFASRQLQRCSVAAFSVGTERVFAFVGVLH